ncbi:pyrroline-5-carboxylate reductase family protein [Streptomyces sp. NPDC056708]|uniref:pyrroline-5-carboxylate reductase family protein n=1 Tax=unclassified Streptomyces TaxID=2593676 RepID=UPI0036B2F102
MSHEPLRLAFVGCGRIARAMVCGLIAAGWPPTAIRGVSQTGAGAEELAREYGITACSSLQDAVGDADVVLLAVHPHNTAEVLADIAPLMTGEQVLVSLVASWQTGAVAGALLDVPCVRAVPNVAVAVNSGLTAVCQGPTAGPEQLRTAYAVFEPLGRVLTVDESLMESMSAVSGAGPALVARFAEALRSSAEIQGFSAEMASELAAYAVHSTGSLMLKGGLAPNEVVGLVASPGGMTEAALHVLAERGLGDAVHSAVDAAVTLSLGRLRGGPDTA